MKLTLTGRNSRTIAKTVVAAMLLTTLVPGVWADHESDIIGGDDAIKINPDFSPTITFDNPILSALGFTPEPVNIVIPSLGAALSQAISASNRPSVLTPYAGQLGGDPDEPVFDTLGSLVTNKATTIGKGNLGLGLSYQHSEFDEFDGEPIGKSVGFADTRDPTRSDLAPVSDPIFGEQGQGVLEVSEELAVSEVKFTADVVTLSITYGLLDRLDIGALIPYIFLRTEGRANYQITTRVLRVDENTGAVTVLDPRTTRKFKGGWDEDFNGFGDIILFTKLQILSQAGVIGETHRPAPLDLAAQLEVKLPTGDEGEFLGTGKTDVAIRLLGQRTITETVLLRGEVGFNRSGLDNDFNTWEWKTGVEWQPLLALAFSAEVIGAWSDEFDTILDGVIGAKYNFPRDLSVFGGVRFPLNDNGLRFDYAPIIGIEKTFQRPFSREADMASLPPRELPEFQPIETPAQPVMQAAPQVPPVQQQPPPAPVAAPAPAAAPVQSALPPEYIVETAPAKIDTAPAPGLPLPQGRNYSNDAKGSTGGRD